MLRIWISAFLVCGMVWGAGAQVRPPTDIKKPDTLRPKPRQPANARQPPSKSRVGSQIVDDTTRNVYGPHTTKWTTEREIFTGRRNYQALDTSINDFHRWTYVQRFKNFYQDLGNNGTALTPIFPVLKTETIGADPGFNSYHLYFKTQEPRLFDTKSPYTRMYLVWGGLGRALTGIEYARNINPKWSIQFNYRPLLTDKQILRQGKGDRHVISHYYDLSTHFRTKDEKYEVFTSFRRIRHRVNENGGISFVSSIQADSSYVHYFGTVSPVLVVATSIEQRNQFHLFHQYAIGKAHLYHTADLGKQVNWYRDDLDAEVDDFYDHVEIDSPRKVLDSVRFSAFQNQIGLKGHLTRARSIFYNAHYKLRSYNQFYKYIDQDTIAIPLRGLEHYVGGQLQLNVDSVQFLSLKAELLKGGYMRAEGEARLKWLDASATRLVSRPTFLQTAYRGQFDSWSNQFLAQESQQVTFFPKFNWGPFAFWGGATWTSMKNYIYFKQGSQGGPQKVLPVQASGRVELVTPEVRVDLAILRKIHLRPQVLYSRLLANPDQAIQIPELFANAQIAFESELFRGNLQVQTGFDFNWRSAYKPLGYDPAIQSYFIQHSVETPSYLLGDVFFNGKMKRGRFFVKYHNFFQFFTGVGQMPTPYYRAMKNVLDFGFDMMLFD